MNASSTEFKKANDSDISQYVQIVFRRLKIIAGKKGSFNLSVTDFVSNDSQIFAEEIKRLCRPVNWRCNSRNCFLSTDCSSSNLLELIHSQLFSIVSQQFCLK